MKADERDFKGVFIPREVWLDKELKIQEKLLIVEIDSLSKSEQGCFASNKHFAEFLHLSEGTIANMISDLRKSNIIQTVKSDGRKRWLKVNWKTLLSHESRLHKKMKSPSQKSESSLHEEVNIDIQYSNTDKVKEENSFTEKGVSKYSADSEWIKRANYCVVKILKNHPSLKEDLTKPHRLQKFAKTIHDCHRLDKVSIDDIQKVIDYATSDRFWADQFRSPEKLRKRSPGMDVKYIFAWLDKANTNGSAIPDNVIKIHKVWNQWREDFDMATSDKPLPHEVAIWQNLIQNVDGNTELLKQKIFNYLCLEDFYIVNSGHSLDLLQKRFSTLILEQDYNYH